MAAGTTGVDRPADREPDSPATTAIDLSSTGSLESLLGRTSAELDRANAELALATRLQTRTQDDVERLERRLRDAEVQCLELREKLDYRDRLLSQVFASRTWRWAQALRRALGRG